MSITISQKKIAPIQRAEMEKLSRLEKRFFFEWIDRNPPLAIGIGFSGYENKNVEIGPRKQISDIKFLKSWLKEFSHIKRKYLLPQGLLTLDIILFYIRKELFERETLRIWEIHPGAPSTIGYCIFQLLTRYRHELRRALFPVIRKVSKLASQLVECREGLKNPSRYLIDIELDTLTRLPAYLHKIRDMAKEVISPKKFRELTKNFTQLERALDEFTDWLIIDAMAECKQEQIISPDLYQKYLKVRGIQESISELTKMAENELRHLKTKLKNLTNQIKSGKLVEEVREEIKSNHPPTFDSVAKYTREAMVRVKRFLRTTSFVTFPPGEKIEIVETPILIRHLVPLFHYIPPPKYSKDQTGILLITPGECGNPRKLKEYCLNSLLSKCITHIYPGQHLQLVWSNRHHSYIRLLVRTQETMDGWSSYCHNRMLEMGFFDSPKEKFMQIIDSIWQTLLFLIDINLNTDNMTPQEAKKLLINEAGVFDDTADAEVKKIMLHPGSSLGYLWAREGIKKVKRIFKEYMKKDYKEIIFHDVIFRAGPLPIHLLERDVKLQVDRILRLKK